MEVRRRPPATGGSISLVEAENVASGDEPVCAAGGGGSTSGVRQVGQVPWHSRSQGMIQSS